MTSVATNVRALPSETALLSHAVAYVAAPASTLASVARESRFHADAVNKVRRV